MNFLSKLGLLTGFWAVGLHVATAQNVFVQSTVPASEFTVCNTASFSVTVTNGEPTALAGLAATITFPAGVEYVPGSVAGANQQNISNLQSPMFGLQNLATGALATFSFSARATCALVDSINMGKSFENDIRIAWTGGAKTTKTIPYIIETPLLVMAVTTGQNLFGALGNELTRTITIRNNRLGALTNFMFQDLHPSGGFTLTASPGAVVTNTPNELKLNFNATHFQQIGDNDGLFELDEQIVITQKLTITDCGISLTQSPSNFTATWGCGSDTCQIAKASANLIIYQADVNPKLQLIPRYGLTEDFCGDRPATQRLVVKNTGSGPAIGAVIYLDSPNQNQVGELLTGIDPTLVWFDSAGIIKPAQIADSQRDTMPDCPEHAVFRNMAVNLPRLRAGDSTTLVFALRSCDQACQNFLPTWIAERGLPLNCPPGLFDTTLYRVAGVPRDTIALQNLLCLKVPLEDNNTYPFTFRLNSNLLRDSVGRLRVTFRLPCGLSWVGGPLQLWGDAATASGVVPDGDAQERWFEFALPFDSAFVAADLNFRWDCDAPCLDNSGCMSFFAANFCPNSCDFDPDSLPYAPFQVRTELFLHPSLQLGCGIKNCEDLALFYECLDSCATPIRGYVEHESTFERTSFGLPDNDDDRFADPAGKLDLSKIRRDRFLPGDSSRLELRGVVRTTQPNGAFQNALLRVYFESHSADNGYMGGTSLDYNQRGDIVPLGGRTLRIVDKSSGQKYTCALPPPDTTVGIRQFYNTLNINNIACIDTIDRNALQFFTHDVSVPRLIAAGCPLPANFRFADGDSLVLTEGFRFMRIPVDDKIFNLRVKTTASIFNGYEPSGLPLNLNAPEQDFSCSCPFTRIQLTGLKTNRTKIKIYLDPCLPSDQPQQSQFSLRLGAGNFFPFEFRPVLKIEEWWNLIAPPVSIAGQQVGALQLQGGGPVLVNFPFPFDTPTDTLYQFQTSVQPLVDEGFTLDLRQQFTAPCDFSELAEHENNMTIAWQPPSPIDTLQTFGIRSGLEILPPDTFGFIPVRPFLFASGLNLNYLSSDDKGRWTLNFVHAGGTVPAANGWIYFENSTGGLTDFQVLRLPGGTPLPQVNGVFQIGDIVPGQVLQVQVTATNAGCQPEQVLAFYGWNCDPVLDPGSPACSRKTLSMSVTPQNAELELDVKTPTASVDLCDTTDYHNIRIFNALQGAAFGVVAQIKLPPGLQIVPGSCQISYPTGQNWVAIPDPTSAPGFGLGWSLAALNATIAQNGLVGFTAAPANSASIRFKTQTVCGFITGEQIRFRTFGDQGCGDSTNILLKPGDPILLNGVPPAADVQILPSLTVPQPVGCADEVPIAVAFLSSAASGTKDSLFVTLPPGVAFVPNSYQPGANAPAAQPAVMSMGGRQILKWKQLPNVPANATVQLTFAATNFGSQGCGVLDTIFMRTTQQQTAVCVADGSVCDATATSGEAFLTVAAYHPEFEVEDFDVDFNAGIAGYKLRLKNAGAFQHSTPTYFKFYRDQDGSGTLTAADLKLHEAAIFFPVGAGQTVDLAGPLPIDLADLCHLIVVLEAADMCLCETIALPIDDISRQIEPKTVCSGAFINLGVAPTPGHKFKWTPATWLECDTCAFPKFMFKNETTQPMTFVYQFTETAGDCVVGSDVSVTVLPQPKILNPDTAICVGEFVTLMTTPAASYEWFGSGIVDPTLPVQVVSPIATSQYFVKITDALGCENIDTVMIAVKPTPYAAIGPDTLGVCGNADLQFNPFFDAGFVYRWSPAGLVSNPDIHNPFFTGTASATLILTVSTPLSDCVKRDTVFVGFSENPTISANAAALTNCIGDTAFVLLSGAQDYFWAPSAGVFCQNPACSVVGVAPTASTTYKILGYNEFGCKDSILLPVVVPGAVQNTSSQMTICAGESATIFGQTQTQAGVYCQPFTATTGCDSTHCVTLTVLDTNFTKQEAVLCPGSVVTIGGITYSAPGQFPQTVPGANGCDSTSLVVITAAQKPNLDTLFRVVWPQDSAVQLGLPGGFAKYEWSPATYLSCADCPNPVADVPAGIDSLSYSVTVTNAAGCTEVVVVILRLLPPCDPKNVPVPNAFTPDNGDQINQTFRVPEYEGFEQLIALRVYDRWGVVMYSTNTPGGTGWDGRAPNGKPLPSDVYVYVLEVGCPGNVGGGKKAGNVTLLR